MRCKNGRNSIGGVDAKGIVLVIVFATLALMIFAVACADCDANGQESSQNTVSADRYSGSCGDGLTFTFDKATGKLVIIKSGPGSGAMIDESQILGSIIPWDDYREEIKEAVIGEGVTHIGREAFRYCSSLEKVIIPNTVKTIGIHAFSSSGIKAIEVPAGVEKLDFFVFAKCKSLRTVVLHEGLKLIERGAFNNCVVNDINFPETLERIENEAFVRSGVYSVKLHEGLRYIGSQAFYGCCNLNNIEIPGSVKEVGNEAFKRCFNLLEVTIGNGARGIHAYAFDDHTFYGYNGKEIDPDDDKFPGYTYRGQSRDEMLIANCCGPGAAYSFDEKTGELRIIKSNGCGAITPMPDGRYPWHSFSNSIKTLIVDKNIAIGERVFENCKSLLSIELSDNVRIMPYAFNGCTSLRVAKLGSTYFIMADAFKGCTSLLNISIGPNATAINENAFPEHRFCLHDEETFISPSDARFTWHTFSGHSTQNMVAENESGVCGNGVGFYFAYADGVLKICKYRSGTGEMDSYPSYDNQPWRSVKGLVETVEICNGVTSIGDYAFCEHKSIKHVIIGSDVQRIGKHAFEDCSSLETVEMHQGVKFIGDNAFNCCRYLKQISLPDGITTIEKSTFMECTHLESVIIPNSVKFIGDNAFSICFNLKSIAIPDGCTVGSNVFSGCRNLREVTIGMNAVVSSDAFPEHKFQMYDGTSITPTDKDFPWHKYKGETTEKMVAQDEEGICGNGLRFRFCYSTGELVIFKHGQGDGELDLYFDWTKIGKMTKTLTINENVKNFNGWSFRGFTALEWINVSEKNADYMSKYGILFNKSQSILVKYPAKHRVTEYSIPDTVAEIGDAAFINASVTSVAIPDSVRKINEYAFQNCQSLNSVLIGKGVKEIGGNAFYSSYSLKSVVIPSNVKSIGASAFSYCTGLDYVTIENGVEEIGASAFYSCRSLKAIVIPGSVKVIECCAFYDCVSLKDVEICEGVNRKGVNASIFSIQEFHLHDGTLVKPSDPQFYWRVYHGESVKVPGRPPLIVMKAVNDAGWCGDGVAYDYNYEKCELTIYRRGQGSGEMKVVSEENPRPWEKYKEEVKIVKFCDGVTSIHDFAFSGFTSLDDVEFAKGLRSIGICAFSSCKSLKMISIPNGIRNIGDSAFYNCPELVEVRIALDVSGIDSNAFPYHIFYKADGKTVITPEDAEFVGRIYYGPSIDKMVADH